MKLRSVGEAVEVGGRGRDIIREAREGKRWEAPEDRKLMDRK